MIKMRRTDYEVLGRKYFRVACELCERQVTALDEDELWLEIRAHADSEFCHKAAASFRKMQANMRLA